MNSSVKQRRARARELSDLGEIASHFRDLLRRICTNESRVHPSIPIPSKVQNTLDRWLDLLKEGAFSVASSAEWIPHPDIDPLLDGAEGIAATLHAIFTGLERCSANASLGTPLFAKELRGAREILGQMPFGVPENRRSFIIAILSLTLATTPRSCIRRAMAFYEVFGQEFNEFVPSGDEAAFVHRIALLRVCDDLAQGSIRTFRHFVESAFRGSHPMPMRHIRDAAFRGAERALERVHAKPSKGRLESLAFIVALGGAQLPDVWEVLRPLTTRLAKTDPSLAHYIVDLFFPVSTKGAPHADDYLRREIQLFFALDQTLATRMQRHLTGYFPLDWENVLRGRIPNLPPAVRGFSSDADPQLLKHHLVDHYVPARRSQRIANGVEIIPAQATALGRLTTELFSIGYGAYITFVPQSGIECQYAPRPHSLVLSASCIDPRSHPGELYLALGKALYQMPLKGTSIRLSPSPLSVISHLHQTEDSPPEILPFSVVCSLLFEVRWLGKRVLGLLRGDGIPHTEDERLIRNHYDRQMRARLLEAEAKYRGCCEQLSLVTDYFQGRRDGAVDISYHPDWLGIYTAAIGVSLPRGMTTVYVPLPAMTAITLSEVDQHIFDQLVGVEPMLRELFAETIKSVDHALSPYPAMRPLLEFVRASERRRSRGGALRLLSSCSRSLVNRTVGTLKACIGR